MLERFLQQISFASLLDIGCGDGKAMHTLAQLHPTVCFMGVDLDRAVLHQHQATTQPGLHAPLIAADAVALPISDQSLDVITCQAVLHHILDTTAAFKEFCRVIRPGGYLLVQDGERLSDAEFEQMNRELCASGFPPEIHPGFDTAALVAMLARHQFHMVQLQDSGQSTFATPPYTSRVYGSRAFFLAAQRTK